MILECSGCSLDVMGIFWICGFSRTQVVGPFYKRTHAGFPFDPLG